MILDKKTGKFVYGFFMDMHGGPEKQQLVVCMGSSHNFWYPFIEIKNAPND